MFPLLLFDISLSLPAETHRAPRGATHANTRNSLPLDAIRKICRPLSRGRGNNAFFLSPCVTRDCEPRYDAKARVHPWRARTAIPEIWKTARLSRPAPYPVSRLRQLREMELEKK